MRARLLGIGLGAAGLLLGLWAFHEMVPVGYDFYHWYWPVPRAWLAGDTALYDEASRGFFSPPWTVWLLLPFVAFDMRWGMAALTLSSAIIIVVVAYRWAREVEARRPLLLAVLALTCPYSLTVLFAGTLDAWSLLGIYGSYQGLQQRRPWLLGAGLLLAAVRPQNVVLSLPLILLATLRSWPPRLLLRAAGFPAAVLAASGLLFGWDWPLRWVDNYRALPPGGYPGATSPYLVTSTYAATNLAGVPLLLVVAGLLALAGFVAWRVWRRGLDASQLELGVAANAAIAPHILSQSYVVLVALPWLRLADRQPWAAALLYAMSLVLLIRPLGLWDRIGLLDVTYPLILFVFLLLQLRRERRASSAPTLAAEKG